jgi:hypothetical protein
MVIENVRVCDDNHVSLMNTMNGTTLTAFDWKIGERERQQKNLHHKLMIHARFVQDVCTSLNTSVS